MLRRVRANRVRRHAGRCGDRPGCSRERGDHDPSRLLRSLLGASRPRGTARCEQRVGRPDDGGRISTSDRAASASCRRPRRTRADRGARRRGGRGTGRAPAPSTALLELWERRDGRSITLQAYLQTGGVRGAVSRLAEEVYGGFTAQQQGLARAVMLRLSAPGEADEAVRRRVPLAEFDPERNADVAHVVEVLTDRRLLTVSEGVVEVAHEALLREWPRLRDWLEEDRAGRLLHAHLMDTARGWAAADRDPLNSTGGPTHVGAGLDDRAHARAERTRTRLPRCEPGGQRAGRAAPTTHEPPAAGAARGRRSLPRRCADRWGRRTRSAREGGASRQRGNGAATRCPGGHRGRTRPLAAPGATGLRTR